MTKFWCIVDVPSLAHRAFHAMDHLSYEGQGTSIIYGVFRDVVYLRERFEPDGFVMCFDGQKNKRRQMFREYKKSRRRKLDKEHRQAFDNLRGQIDRLYRWHFKAVGFRNVFREEGYEADDLVAEAAVNLPRGDRAVIVSMDNDLLQLLSSTVTIWNPMKKERMTADMFRDRWGLCPGLWADVKAIAGCTSDELPGVAGVGEKTAAKFLTGQLKSTTKAHASIVAGHAIYKRNIELTRLPLVGTPKMELREDRVTDDRWDQVMDRVGIKKLRKR